MIRAFKKILDAHQMLHLKKQILVGVSGGVDSVVLLHLLREIDEARRPDITVAHVNHQLRDESDQEEVFVRELAASFEVPFYSYTWKKTTHPTSGIEEEARKVRYQFFKEIMDSQGPTVLMTAHHQDDQVETVMMRLARGSSLEQLTGIQFIQPFHRGQLMRPLLPFSKEKLVAYARKHQIRYVEDATNHSLDYTRNRYRHLILPLIKEENAQFNEHIEQLTKDIQDLLAVSKQPIQACFKQLVRRDGEALVFDYHQFLQLDPPMQRALLKEIFMKLYKGADASYKTTYIEMVRSWLMDGKVNTSLSLLNDLTAQKGYEDVRFEKEKKAEAKQANEVITLEKLNEWVPLSEIEAIGLFAYDGQAEEDETLIFDADKVRLPLTIRHRQAGDRMRYKGLGGTKKIKDIFIDEKIPPKKRDQAWLVEDADGQIIWLLPYRKMDLLSAGEPDKIAYVLKYKTTK